MKIVVNTLVATREVFGTRTYLLGLLRGMLEADRENEYHLICRRSNCELFQPCIDLGAGRVRIEIARLPPKFASLRVAWEQLVLPMKLRGTAGDSVLLSPANIASIASPVPQVVIVHGFLVMKSMREALPSANEVVSTAQRIYFDTLLPLTMRRATRVVAVSEYVRKRILRDFPSAADKVRTVPEGVDTTTFYPDDPCRTEPYVLFVGSLWPYKNADCLIEAFAAYYRRSGVRREVRLRVIGEDPDGQQVGRLRRLAADLEVSDRVDFVGVVNHERLRDWYARALVLVLPSSLETFGLPVLEAMACGTPVIASSSSALPETVGRAGILIDRVNSGELAAALERVLADDALRQRLRRAGLERAREFSWHESGRRMLEVIAEASHAG